MTTVAARLSVGGMDDMQHIQRTARPDCQVLVVGAGPTRLVLAADLLARGVSTRIIDKGDGVNLETRAIGMHARALEVLDLMGLAERFVEHGQIVRWFRFYADGKPRLSLDLSRNGTRFGYAHNLGWKLALVAVGRAPGQLLDTYGREREPVAAQVLGLTHTLVRFGTVTHPVKRALRDTIVPAAFQVGPIHRRAVRRWTQVNVAYPASSLTRPDRGRGRPRPGQRVPDIEVRTPDGTSRLFTVLRRGRHVMVVTGADPDSVLASPALQPYWDLFEVITRSGDARAFRGGRAGSVFLVRPDGYLAARGRPDRLEMVLGYFRELSGETEVSRPGRPTATSPALPTVPLVSDSSAIPDWAASTREGDLLIPEGADVDLDGERLVDPERLALAGHRVLHVGGSHQAQHGDGKVRVGIDQPVPFNTRPGVVRHLGDVIFRGAVGGDDLDRDEHAVGQVLVSGLDVGRQSCDVDNRDVRNATVPGSVGGRNPGCEHPRLDACPGDGRTQRGLGVIDDDLVVEAVPRRHEHPPVTHLVSAFVRGKPDRVVEVVHGVRSETPVMRDAHASSSGSLP